MGRICPQFEQDLIVKVDWSVTRTRDKSPVSGMECSPLITLICEMDCWTQTSVNSVVLTLSVQRFVVNRLTWCKSH